MDLSNLENEVFETAGLPVALSIITLIFVILVLLPFIDRSEARSIGKRMKFVTLGAIFVAEVAALSVWGKLTPGKVIPNEQGALVLGGIGLLVTLGSVAFYKLLGRPNAIVKKDASSAESRNPILV